MNIVKNLSIAGVLSGAILIAIPQAYASQLVVHPAADGQEKTFVSKQFIEQQVRQADVGSLISTILKSNDKGYFYEAKVIDTKGMILAIHYNAETGKMLGISNDWSY